MNYELAKKLKDVGFLQKLYSGDGFIIHNTVDVIYCNTQDFVPEDTYIRVPTLDRLVEACGDGFRALERVTNGNRFKWEANTIKITPMVYYGHSLEEAVANLWLALNEKK